MKNYKFWLAVLASVIVLINTLGAVFGFSVDEVAITSIATAVLGIFVALGFVNKNEKQQTEKSIDESKIDNEQNSEQKFDEQILEKQNNDSNQIEDENVALDIEKQHLQNDQNNE